MLDSVGVCHLFVYDTAKQMWHKEDHFHARAFCSCGGDLYAIDEDTGKIVSMLGIGETAYEDSVKWMVQTGEIGISSPDMKYISRVTIRMAMDVGAKLHIYAQYDLDKDWLPICDLVGTSLRSFSIPIRPRRCDHMKLRMEGEGMAKVYSITKTIEQGSELS